MLYKQLRYKLTLILIMLFMGFSQTTYATDNARYQNSSYIQTGTSTIPYYQSNESALQYHVVEKGDTLYKLAGRYGITVNDLIDINEIRDPNLLQIGQQLRISKSVNTNNTNNTSNTSNTNNTTSTIATKNKQDTHKVQIANASQRVQYQVMAGDTFYKIARNFGVSVEDLIRSNPIHDPKHLQIGQNLKIPSVDFTTFKAMGGQEYTVEKILYSTLTAYTAGHESTGKTPDHPQYGITYSGKKVQEGRTIAVDPSVIDLGTSVYIEGVGLRIAEDIGSAIKGSKIDVFIDDLEEALQFGVKKDVKVYVLSN